jgi:hypothetical protein
MIKGINFGLGLLLVAVAFIACAQEENMILELKDVQFFQAEQINTSPVTIKLSGLAFHSSLAIRDVTTSQYGDSLQVLVHLTPVTGDMTGNLDYDFAIPSTINSVSFGKEKVIIWSRTSGVVQR